MRDDDGGLVAALRAESHILSAGMSTQNVHGYLFADGELREWLGARRDECQTEMQRLPESDLLAGAIDALAGAFTERFCVIPLTLHETQMSVEDRGEHPVWGSGGLQAGRVSVNTGAGAPGHAVTVRVPFSGTPRLWILQPSTWGSIHPEARLEQDVLLFPFVYPAGSTPPIKHQMEDILQRIEEPWLRSQGEDVGRFNAELAEFVTSYLTDRRERLLANRAHLDGLGLPIYRPDSAPQTYAAAAVERRPAPKLGGATPQQAPPIEPTLVEDLYNHIIGVITSMARGMERTPGDYASWAEEQLRDSLLVMLNTHYQGGATGETFNKSGKTDVLVREGDRNVFVGECKWWEGAAAFAGVDRDPPSALDQLRNYATWRDARLALTVFVHNQSIGDVISSARAALETHPAFVSWATGEDEGLLRCRVRMTGAGDRAADLAVVFVHLPRK
jgi:hypothetical protein